MGKFHNLLPAFGVFAAAARYQNFAHAAEELHLTASAVSHHVRRLEASLGVILFKRHARGVLLTAAGRALSDAASNALADMEAASARLRVRPSEVRQLRITTLHSFTYCWLMPRLQTFTTVHPDIRINIETGSALTRFDDAGPDLAIRHGPGQWPGLIAQHLMDEELFPVASPALPGVKGLTRPEQIQQLPLVSDLAHHGWADWFRAAGVRDAPVRELHTFSDSTDAMQAAVFHLGAVLGRTCIAEPYLASGQLIRLPGPAMKSRFSYYAAYPAHRRPSEATSAFITWLREEAQRKRVTPDAARSRVRRARTSPA